MTLVNKFVKGISPQDKMLDMLSNNIFDGYSSQGHQLLIFDDLVSEIQDDLRPNFLRYMDIIEMYQ